jgi:glycosyltransferase involved in cell wall biosynthesis/coenzyme F420-reducing hydrogenase beta subunit
MQKKVSIITPCFNGEKHVKYFLNSILKQTYKNIEFIFINDGSTDKTEKILKSFENKFRKRGIEFHYLYQKNQGQAASLNNGLKIFTGEYLTWPDSDDILSPSSIEKKVNLLENNQQYGFVRTDGNVVQDRNLKRTKYFLSGKNPNRFKENIFEDYILGGNDWYVPGCFMIRTQAFLDVNPSKEIYSTAQGSQNIQMILPVSYKYKCGYIDEPLYTYVYRTFSRSHYQKSYIQFLKRHSAIKDIFRNVILSIEGIDKNKYLEIIEQRYQKVFENTIKKHLCYGCGACVYACPQNALEMKEDLEGFLYPGINIKKCNHCNVCDKVCPILKTNYKPVRFNAKHGIAVRSDTYAPGSASGGAFALMADKVLSMGGYAAGAVFNDDWKVEHIVTNKASEINKMRGSKYLQSDIRTSYRETKSLLDDGKFVLFSSTPCQIAGLYGFLQKDYENLLTVDLICHGVNSPTVWTKYLEELTEGRKEISSVIFRNKAMNLTLPYNKKDKEYFTIQLANGRTIINDFTETDFYKGFSKHLFLRPCCAHCEYSGRKRQGDITIGDIWTKEAAQERKKGISQVLINSEKGKVFFNSLERQWSRKYDINLNKTKHGSLYINGHISIPHPSRNRFFDLIQFMPFKKALDYSLNKKFDIAIAGMHAPNYGNLLTVYSMYRVITDMGYAVLMLDRPLTSIDKPSKTAFSLFSQLPYPEYALADLYPDKKAMKELNNRIGIFLLPSDQVLGTIFVLKYDKYTLLDWVRDDKPKIAYASSFGMEYFDGDNNLRAEMGFYLNRFDAVSVREESGIEYAKINFGIDAEQTLDPVFLCDSEIFKKMSENNVSRLPQRSFLGGYLLQPNNQRENIIRSLLSHLDIKSYYIITDASKSINQVRNLWNIDSIEGANVNEFLACIQNCECFITDSFHGVCFSIIFRKQFIALFDKNINRAHGRIYDLLHKLNLERRIVETYDEITDYHLLDTHIDYDEVYTILNSEINRSRSWLKNTLNNASLHKKNKSVYDIMDEKINEIEQKYLTNFHKSNKQNKVFFRRIKRGLKCLKKNGLFYSIKLLIKKSKKYLKLHFKGM